MKTLPWWKCGLIGGVVLGLATIIKLVKFITRSGIEAVPETTGPEVLQFGLFLFGSGFACGVALWAVQSFVRGPRWISDALTGLIVLEVLFICCAAMFEPTWLTTNRAQGLPMFLFAGGLGLILGPWIGRDMRKELRK